MPWPLSEATPALFLQQLELSHESPVAPNLQLLTFGPQPLVLPSLPLYFVTPLLPARRRSSPPPFPGSLIPGPLITGVCYRGLPAFPLSLSLGSAGCALRALRRSAGRSFPAASLASSRSRPLSSSVLKRPSRQSQRRKSSGRRSPFCELHSEHADTTLR